MNPPKPNSSPLRFLTPSARDIIFIFLFWSLLAGPLSRLPLADPDIGWHIRTGELMLATRTIPRTDPFSSTMHGQPWFAWEWLYDLLLGSLHRCGGLNGVEWLCALLVSATFLTLMSQLLKRGTSLLLAVWLTLLAEAVATIHLYARPHIVSWLFSLLWFVALERWELAKTGTIPRWLPWFFPASMLFWVNLHGGWVFGIVLLTIYTFSAFVETVRSREPFAAIRAAHRAQAMSVAWITSAMATFVNPYGWRLHEHVFRYLGDRFLMNHISEFRSPDFHGWPQRCFAIVLLLVLVALAGDRAAERGKLSLTHLLVTLLALYSGFYSARNLPVSAMLLLLIAGPMLWGSFGGAGEKAGVWTWLRKAISGVSGFSARMSTVELGLRGHLLPVVFVGFAFTICLQGGWLGPKRLVHSEFDPEKVPTAAVSFLQDQARGKGDPVNVAPVFSTDTWGGYLIYRMYPERKVVLDDRHDLYGADRVREYVILTHGEPGWRGLLDKWRIQTVLLPAGATLANLLRELPQDWGIIHEDKVAVVFGRIK